MKAMILAAGFGTRLGHLTQSLPKALVPIQQKPALAWHLQRLQNLGVHEFAINTHYRASQIEQFVCQMPSCSSITLFPEFQILGTGGGLLNTRHFWSDQPFFLYNVDVFCTADLLQSYRTHQQQNNLATLLTQDRTSQTKLLVDQEHYVCGIHYYKTQEYRLLRKPKGTIQELGFNGIHIIEPKIFSLITESGCFSIIDCYLRLIQQSYPIRSFNIGNAYWKDMGTLEKLKALQEDWNNHPQLGSCYR